jgi:hypothetical protein
VLPFSHAAAHVRRKRRQIARNVPERIGASDVRVADQSARRSHLVEDGIARLNRRHNDALVFQLFERVQQVPAAQTQTNDHNADLVAV